MGEKIIKFDNDRLVGILNQPEQSSITDQPVIIFLNAGLLHRVGPFRMYVELARQCGASGWSSFRFDCSNIGDSENFQGEGSLKNRVVLDGIAAMDCLSRQYDVKKFIVMGLCSGADNAHKLAVADERIKGVVFWDGYGYPTLKFRWVRVWQLITNLERISTIIKSKLFRRETSIEEDTDLELFVWTLPDKDKTLLELQSFIDRDVKQLYFYTGGVRNYYNYVNQLFESFSDLNLSSTTTVHCNYRFDHTYVLKDDRNHMAAEVLTWLTVNFPQRALTSE